MQFSEEVKKFIHETPWTFAKTYAATWPHEYLCRNYPPEEEEIINRCRNDQTYAYRKEHGTLPGGG
jgi:hypothetical protein